MGKLKKCLLIIILVVFCYSPQLKAEDYTLVENGNADYLYKGTECIATVTHNGNADYIQTEEPHDSQTVLSLT
jgi:hypothetical protein